MLHLCHHTAPFTIYYTLYIHCSGIHYMPLTSAILLHCFNYEEERGYCWNFTRKQFHYFPFYGFFSPHGVQHVFLGNFTTLFGGLLSVAAMITKDQWLMFNAYVLVSLVFFDVNVFAGFSIHQSNAQYISSKAAPFINDHRVEFWNNLHRQIGGAACNGIA